MDNSPGDEQPTFIPARRSYEIVQYPAARRRPSFLVLFFVIFSALLAFWLVRHWIHAYRIHQAIHQLKKEFPSEFAPGGVAPVEHRSYVSVSPPLVGPYHLPLSVQYRLAGKIQGEYLATSGSGAYILIPAKDCQLVNGGPYCKYHGSTVMGTSGR
ncbi:hypothetical protein [Acidithiobacillus sp.]|jgi:hypothetical protein|uniref:hypothetical protein n=1 Tax=Acidithiobacillus sp. TaxID=1872118 RepID=UPI0035651CAE